MSPWVVGALALSLGAGQVPGEPVPDGARAGPAATRPAQPAEPDASAAPGAGVDPSADVRPVVDLFARLATRVGESATPGTRPVPNLQFEVTAGIAASARHQGVAYRLAYSPYVLEVISGPGAGTFVNQALNLGVDVAVDPSWLLTFTASGTYGTQSGLAPAAPPAGGVPAPPTLYPGSTSLESWAAAARAGATGRLSPVSRLRLAVEATASAGIGTESRLSLPPQGSLRVEGAYDLRLSSRTTLATVAYASDTRLQRTVPLPDGNVTSLRDTFLTGVLEAWRHRPAPRTELSLGLGGAWANSESTTLLSYGRLMPVVELRVAQELLLDAGQPAVRPQRSGASMLQLGAVLGYAPYVDPRSALAYERATLAALLDWPFQPRWTANVTLSAALVPYRGLVAERYGNAEASATYAPLPFASFRVGVFWNYQDGAPALVSAFRAWGASLTVALHEAVRF